MKLLVETLENDISLISEGVGTEKKLYLEGPHINMNVRNGNGRLYEDKRVVPGIEKYINEFISKNRALGELNHPNRPSVEPAEAASKVVSLIREGNDYVGRSKIMCNLPKGAIAKGLIEEGVKLAVSTRALGTVDKNKSVNEDYDLRAIDIVLDPSGPTCFQNAIMEDVEWVYDAISKSWRPSEQLNDAYRVIEETKALGRKDTRLMQAKAVDAFNRFIKAIA